MTAVLAATATLLAVLLGWSIWRGRRAFRTSPGAFRCNVRLRSEQQVPGIASTWARRPCHALWAHDVLVVRRGLLRPRLWFLVARMAEGDLVELNPRLVRGLGRRPVSVKILLDDHQEIEVAAGHGDRSLLVGPFVAVAVRVLPGDSAPE
jgi:hypothetical protein